MKMKKRIEEWTKLNEPIGKSLGYPPCCIKAFCQQPPEALQNKKPSKEDVARAHASLINGKWTGFIPCYEHAVQINSGQITLQSLIQDRDPMWMPFPFENG